MTGLIRTCVALLFGLWLGVTSTLVGASRIPVVEPPTTQDSRKSTQPFFGFIEQWQSISGAFDRSVYLDNWLLNNELTDVLRLYDQAGTISNQRLRATFQDRIVERVASIDPPKALEIAETRRYVRQQDSYYSIFREWVLSDIDTAIEHASELPEDIRRIVTRAVVFVRDDLDESNRMQFLESLRMERFGLVLLEQVRIRALLDQPEVALREVLNDEKPNREQVDSLIQVALAWIEKDGINILPHIGEQLAFGTRRNLLQGVFKTLAQSDAEKAFRNALTVLDHKDSSVLSNILSGWGSKDALSAFNAIQWVESEDLRNALQSKQIQNWSVENPFGLLDSLDSIPENLRQFAETQALQYVSMIAPAKAATHVAETSGENFSAVQSFVSGWAVRDAQSAMEWIFESPYSTDRRWELLGPIFNRLSVEDADRLLDVVEQIPLDPSEIGEEVHVVRWVAKQDIVRALDLLPRIRAGITKEYSYREVGRKLAELNRNSEAVALAEYLSIDQRRRYIRSLTDQWVSQDSTSVMDYLQLLENESDKSSFALSVIGFHRIQEFLTSSQKVLLEGMLTSEDAEILAEDSRQ